MCASARSEALGEAESNLLSKSRGKKEKAGTESKAGPPPEVEGAEKDLDISFGDTSKTRHLHCGSLQSHPLSSGNSEVFARSGFTLETTEPRLF